MAARWIALAIGLATLAIAGIFVVAALRPPPPDAAGTEVRVENPSPGAKRYTARAGAWTVVADLTQDSAGAVAISLSITDAAGRPAAPAVRPTAALSMVGMAMGKEPVALVQDTAGRWRGAGRPAMAGRWNLQLDIDGASLSLQFDSVSR